MNLRACDSGVGNRGPIQVWVSDLSWGALPALAMAYVRYGRLTLRYTAATRSGAAVGRLLQAVGMLAAPAEFVDYTRHGEHVDGADSASFRIQAQMEAFVARFFTLHRRHLEELQPWDARVPSQRLAVNLRSVVITQTYLLLSFVEFARHWHRTTEHSAGRLVVISPMALFADGVPPGWAGDDVEFRCPAGRASSLVFWSARSALQCVLDALRRPRPASRPPASIGVEYAHGLDRSQLMDDLFWWWGSGIPAERITLFFDRPDQPVRREIVARAQQLGLRCVVLNRQAAGDLPELLWRPAPGLAVSARRLWRVCRMALWGLRRVRIGRRLAGQLLQLSCWAARMEDFFTDFNIRGVFHYQNCGLDAHSVACDAVGAVRIGYQWSHLPWPMLDSILSHHVYFSWGPQSANMQQRVGSCMERLLLSGCIINGAHPAAEAAPELPPYRAALAGAGASRILALFDSSLPCERFYEFFLRRVLDDPRWGLLIKPKRPMSVSWRRQRLPALEALYRQAAATGRVRMLDHQLSPAHAAAVADVSVGVMVVGISTPAVVAALAGRRAVQLDYLRLHESYLSEWAVAYRAGPDRLVFDDPERLWAALNRAFDEPDAEGGLGLMEESLLNEIDPFRDGRAGERIGEYVRWYLDGLDRGLSRDRALEEAGRRYAQRWGSSSVIAGPAATRPAAPAPADDADVRQAGASVGHG